MEECLSGCIFLATISITLTSGSMTNKFLPRSVLLLSPPQLDDHSHFAKEGASKYPEVALPSDKGPTILDPNPKAEVV